MGLRRGSMTEEKKTFICLKDAISVVYRTKHMVDLTDSMKSVVVAKDAIVLGLEKLPTIEEPKTGHWIEEDMFDGDIAYRCSECDEPFCLIDGTPTDNMYNFCPNCGAKMEREK